MITDYSRQFFSWVNIISLRMNPLPHFEQLWGLTSRWVYRWLLRLLLSLNCFPQNSQLNNPAVWAWAAAKWLLRADSHRNILVHNVHLICLSLWVLMWILRYALVGKLLAHISHMYSVKKYYEIDLWHHFSVYLT